MAYSTVESRSGKLTIISFFLFFLLALSLLRLQVIHGSYYRNLSEKNRLRLIHLEGPRGNIIDRKGNVLAQSRLSFNVTAISREKPSKIKKSFNQLSAILGEEAAALEARYKKRKAGVYHSIILAEDIPADQAMAIEERIHMMPGVMIETKPVRTYPFDASLAHVLGYIGPQSLDESEELELSGYQPSDWIGREGIEKNYESYLRGHSGGLQIEVNSRGQYLKVLSVKEPKEGRDIQLSVDADLQVFVQKKFEGRRGAVAVMDLQSGGLLCLNSSPSYDSNLFSSTRGRKEVGKFLTHEWAPMFNRAIQGQYPPGSIFKIVTALAALEENKIKLSSTANCLGFMRVGGKRFGCWKEDGHHQQNLYEAFAHSCDVFFYTAGLAVGPDVIHRKAVEMGFFGLTGIDLPAERSGLVPSRGWKQRKKKSSWFDGDTMNFSIGQGYLLVTPLQALDMISIIALNGNKLKPHLVEKIDGVNVAVKYNTLFQVNPDYLKAVQKGLEDVVNTSTGTGRLAKVEGVKLAGKTGTAQTNKEQNHAWYVGYAPADQPKIAFVVFLEFGGHGGVEAALFANGMMQKIKELGYL